jgi:hypothetical protein
MEIPPKVIEVFNPSGQWIGNIADGVFYTTRKPEHFMKKFQGFGLSKSVIGRCFAEGVTKVAFRYEGKEVRYYHCDLKKFCDSTKEFNFAINGVLDPQKFVSIKDMEEMK